MAVEFSPVIPVQARGNGDTFSVKSLDLESLGRRVSPIAVLDEFRVRGRPFGPHPHAGFSAITYVLEDSPGGARSRDSLGNDILVGPGGIIWTQAGRGVIHDEMPAARDRELHGLQIFVNLSAKNKLIPPQVFQLARSEMREWRPATGDRVRVVVGSFEDLSSPLVPAEPFTFLDVDLRHEVAVTVPQGHNALIYVRRGTVLTRAGDLEQTVDAEHALAIRGSGASVKLQAVRDAHVIIFSGAEIHEPVLAEGPFIMNERLQIEAAVARYRAGEMGQLAPLPGD
jgi:redox-sensitive bicupin YhaK (pirin superfamily)